MFLSVVGRGFWAVKCFWNLEFEFVVAGAQLTFAGVSGGQFLQSRSIDGCKVEHLTSRPSLYSSMKAQHQQHIFIRNVGFHECWVQRDQCEQ